MSPVVRSASTWRQPAAPRATPLRQAVLDTLVAHIESLPQRRPRVVVDGRSAAGKSTLADELAQLLAADGRAVLRASLDDFKRPWAERHHYDRESGEGYYRNAFDLAAVRQLLLDPFELGGSGVVALCSIDPVTQRDHSGELVDVPKVGMLVVDGVFAMRPELDNAWDLRIWLDVDHDTAVRRGVARDSDREGEAAEALHRGRYAGAEAVYLAEVDPLSQADVVVDTTDHDAPRLLRGAARRDNEPDAPDVGWSP